MFQCIDLFNGHWQRLHEKDTAIRKYSRTRLMFYINLFYYDIDLYQWWSPRESLLFMCLEDEALLGGNVVILSVRLGLWLAMLK